MSREFELLEVDRRELVERVLRLRAACTLVVAPSGYGKSRFVRQLTRASGTSAVCDLAGVDSVEGFTKAIASAFAASGLAAGANGLFAGGCDGTENTRLAGWDELIDALCCASSPPNLLVFENAQSIADRQLLVDRVVRIAHLGRSQVVICSRSSLQSPWLRRFAPHDLLRVGVRDLEFQLFETRALFLSVGVTQSAAVDAALQIAAGRPSAVMQVARSAADGDLEPVDVPHGRSGVSAFAGNLKPEEMGLLGAIARIGIATSEDLTALEVTAAGVLALTGYNPFFIVEGDELHVHRVARAIFCEDARACTALAAAARRLGTSDPLRAARYYLLAGESDAAARALEDTLRGIFPAALAGVALSLAVQVGSHVISRHPRLWAWLALLREHQESFFALAAEAREIYWSAGTDICVGDLIAVTFSLVRYLLGTGQYVEAANFVDALESRTVAHAASESTRAARMLRAAVRARKGESMNLSSARYELGPLMDAHPETVAFFFFEVAALGAVNRLARPEARSYFERAIEATSDGSASRKVEILTFAAFFAWCAGEEDLLMRYRSALDALAEAVTDARWFLTRFAGAAPDEAVRCHLPGVLVAGSIIGAASHFNPSARERQLHAAVDAAATYGWVPFIVLASLALAQTVPELREEALERARLAARKIEDPAWRDALAMLHKSGSGPLGPFVRRFAETQRPRLFLSIASRRLKFRSGGSIALTPREFSVLAALASAGKAIDAKRLCEMLFGGEDSHTAVQALRVWISRLRAKVMDVELIVSNSSGYCIGPDVIFDLSEAERILTIVDRGGTVGAADLELLEELAATPEVVPVALAREPWAEPLLHRFDAVRYRCWVAVAQTASCSGDHEKSVRLMRAAIAEDPLDENAVELLMSAHLQAGNPREAQRVFRSYEITLYQETGARPASRFAHRFACLR